MKWILRLSLCLVLSLSSSCSISHHVRDIQTRDNKLQIDKCETKVYFALYGIVSAEECKWEEVK